MTPDQIRRLEKIENIRRVDLRRAWNNQTLLSGGIGKRDAAAANLREKRIARFDKKFARRTGLRTSPRTGLRTGLRTSPRTSPRWQSRTRSSWTPKPRWLSRTTRRTPSKYTTLVPGEKWEIVTWENEGTPNEKKVTTYKQYKWSNYNQGVVDTSRGDGDCGYHSIAKGLKLAKGIDVTGPTLRSMIAENPLWNHVYGTHKEQVVHGRVPWMSQERFEEGLTRSKRGKSNANGWMGDAEIAILAWMYDVCIVVYHPHATSEFDRWSLISPSGNDDKTVECTDPKGMIYLYNSSQVHYDLLTNLKFKEDGEITSEDQEDDDETEDENKSSDEDSANDYGANHYGANDYGANHYGANDYGANHYGANDYGANHYGANEEDSLLSDMYSANNEVRSTLVSI